MKWNLLFIESFYFCKLIESTHIWKINLLANLFIWISEVLQSLIRFDIIHHNVYGCSFVAKLSWKKNFFFEKIFVFYKIYIICRKKKFILIFFYWKNFFTENEKNIYLIWEIYFYPENIYSFCKKSFLIIKNLFVKTSWWIGP